MPVQLSVPTPLEYFASLVQSDADFPLLEAAASLAQDEYPELDVQQLLGDVDQLQAKLQRRLPADASAMHRLRLLNQFFFADLGFGANVNHYYDPDNSYLNAVLRTRRGIPVSLALLWMELAQGLRLDVQGIAFPGHFMVRVVLPQGQVVMDPLSGQSLSREALVERLAPYPFGSGLAADDAVLWERYLQPATPRETLARMLRNLQEIYRAQGDRPRLLAVLNRLIVLLPQAWDSWRDRGLVHAECGHRAAAAMDWETYLAHTPPSPERALIARRLKDLGPG
ncbi:MAG: tetratricopeptide repeat protein [Burkholderiaceae bacterium]|nr:tetratricopeptide repeat protein [Burkholderiaceae bacterium]